MYVAVDMKALRFLPVGHPDVNALTNLVWLEQPVEDEIWMFDIYDHSAFNGFTAYQQSKLYCNTTGAEKAPRFGEPLCRLLVELAQRVPCSDVQPVRLNMQCEKVTEEEAGTYLYDPTGYRPVRKPDLWGRPVVSLAPAQNEAAIVAAGRPARPPKAVPAPVQPQVASVAPTPAPAATSPITQPWARPAPPQGTVAAGIKKPWEK
jgi:hypothetical protein